MKEPAGIDNEWPRDVVPTDQMFSMRGRVVIITGAGQGIGRAFARAISAAGGTSIIAERNLKQALATAEEIRGEGGKAEVVETDVSNPASVQSLASWVRNKCGRIDVLINNAAIFSALEMRSFDQIPLDEWEQVLKVNLTGPFLCARAVLPAMRNAKWGRIINIASGAVTLGRPNYLHYIASKGALEGMTKSMARELGAYGITVNAILPGATFTEIERETVSPDQKEKIIASQCIPRAQVPSDLIGAILFLASDASGFVTGQALTVDGGATHR